MQFLDVKMLQDVLTTFAKKLIILFNVAELQEKTILSLAELFNNSKGDHQVTIEVLELEKIKKEVVSEIQAFEPFDDENEEELIVDESTEEGETTATVVETTIEEKTIVVTRLSMPSRKLKIQISIELLAELEKMQINFKLN